MNHLMIDNSYKLSFLTAAAYILKDMLLLEKKKALNFRVKRLLETTLYCCYFVVVFCFIFQIKMARNFTISSAYFLKVTKIRMFRTSLLWHAMGKFSRGQTSIFSICFPRK